MGLRLVHDAGEVPLDALGRVMPVWRRPRPVTEGLFNLTDERLWNVDVVLDGLSVLRAMFWATHGAFCVGLSDLR